MQGEHAVAQQKTNQKTTWVRLRCDCYDVRAAPPRGHVTGGMAGMEGPRSEFMDGWVASLRY